MNDIQEPKIGSKKMGRGNIKENECGVHEMQMRCGFNER